MAKNAKFSLKLLIDDKRNKVVLAEADQDLVDVLISLLSLPMGKVSKLLENNKMVLGCFKNLNKSVEDMGIEHFETEACKSMLLNPKSTNGIHCKRLKLNLSYIDDTSLFMCGNFIEDGSCSNVYCSFNTSRCSCGALINVKIDVPEEEQVGEVIGDMADGVFVNCRSSFIVTDDLKVTESSIDVIMQVLKDQGYPDFTDLRESLLDVGFDEVVTLLGCLFTSETPLTSAFLEKNMITKKNKMLSPLAAVKSSNSLCSVKVYVRKFDKEIMYAECNEDFIDSLVSFLFLPLELAYSLSNDNTNLTCVGNLCKSPCRRASASNFYQFHDFYNCKNSEPFMQITHSSPVYECLIPPSAASYISCKFARQITRSRFSSKGARIVNIFPNDPKVKPGTSSKCGNGFMKRNTKFIVSNDLVISPMNSASIIDLSKKMQLRISDLEVHQINISKTELINILRASLISPSALTNGLSNFLTKKIKEET